MRQAQENGLSLVGLDEWLTQRAGEPLSPAAKLLAGPGAAVTFQLQRCLVLHAPTPALADGLLQWPLAAGLARGRLGPTALPLDEDKVPAPRTAIAPLGPKWAGESLP